MTPAQDPKQWKIGPEIGPKIREIGTIGNILLFFSLLLSKWADNRSTRWIKSKINSWPFYFFIFFVKKPSFLPKSTFSGSWDFGKKVQKGTAASRPILSKGGGRILQVVGKF